MTRWVKRQLGLAAVFAAAVFVSSMIDAAIIGKLVQYLFAAIGAFAGLAFVTPSVYRWVKNFGDNPRQLTLVRRWAITGVIAIESTRLFGGWLIIPMIDQPAREKLAEGLVYRRYNWQGSEINELAVDLELVRPEILTASTLAFGKRTLSEMIEQSTGVVGAVNADFFDEGGPQGYLVRGGRLTAPNRDRASLTFSDDGTRAGIEFYRFATTARVVANGHAFPIRQTYNNMYTPGEVGVYTASRGVASGAGSIGPVIQARVSLTRGQDGDIRLEGLVNEVVKNPATNLNPAPDEIIVVAGNETTVPADMGAYNWARNNLFPNTLVKIDLSASPKPGAMVVSGGPEFLRFGQYFAREKGNEIICNARTARTAVGIAGNGRYLLVVMVEGPPKWASVNPRDLINQLLKLKIRSFAAGAFDNLRLTARAGCQHLFGTLLGLTLLSRGMTLQNLSRYMTSQQVNGLPIESALNLDGGSSSAMVLRTGGKTRCVCTPMEGRQIQLATALGFSPRP